MSKLDLEESLGFEIGYKCLLVTYHPVTLDNSSAEEQSKNLLATLEQYRDYRIIFTMPNSDTNGRIIMQEIEKFVERNKERSIVFKSLGLKRYLSVLQYVSAVVGNSSSGIIEVPSFGIPSLNIGARQKGRIAAESVVHCGTTLDEIIFGFHKVLSDDQKLLSKQCSNPYEKQDTTNRIIRVIKDFSLNNLIRKSFYNL